jgi:hypothetical protein
MLARVGITGTHWPRPSSWQNRQWDRQEEAGLGCGEDWASSFSIDRCLIASMPGPDHDLLLAPCRVSCLLASPVALQDRAKGFPHSS